MRGLMYCNAVKVFPGTQWNVVSGLHACSKMEKNKSQNAAFD